jgi:hypothetical protein
MTHPKNIKLNMPSNEPVVLERNRVDCLQWRNWTALSIALIIVFSAFQLSYLDQETVSYWFGDFMALIGLRA